MEAHVIGNGGMYMYSSILISVVNDMAVETKCTIVCLYCTGEYVLK